MFVVDQSGKVYAIDAKAKAKRREWDDTGIDYRHYNKYFDLEKGNSIDVWVFFGDHLEGYVYGALLSDLRRPALNPPGCKPGAYPRIEGQIIYFPRSSMSKIFMLTDEQRATLAALTRRDERQQPMFA